MKTLEDHLAQYAAYHRDARNIATHLVGIPMIVFAVEVLLSRPALGVLAGIALSPALLLAVAFALFYLRLDLRFGIVMTALFALGQGRAGARTAAHGAMARDRHRRVRRRLDRAVRRALVRGAQARIRRRSGRPDGRAAVRRRRGRVLRGLRGDVRREVERRAGPVHGGAHSHV